MKTQIFAVVSLAGILCAGCSSGVFPMGQDTYMVAWRGTYPEFTLEAKCLKKANKFCEKHGEAMVFVSKSGHDMGFNSQSSCEVIFRMVPTNSPLNQPPILEGEQLVH
jgi:hypothetical protein